MKNYEIYDYENKLHIGILLYYEKSKTFIIELSEDLDEWTAPLLFSGYVKQRKYTISRDISLLWVRERIVPVTRQNIDSILNTHHLKEYDEMKILEIANGKCAQDSLMIRNIEEVPLYVIKRQSKNLMDIMVSGDSLICFFNNDSCKIVDIHKLDYIDGIDKLLSNRDLFESAEIGIGGYYATFNNSIDIPAIDLFNAGTRIPLSRNDFVQFVKNNVLDTTETCHLLSCSRQNLAYLAENTDLSSIKEVRGNLYIKGDIMRNTW